MRRRRNTRKELPHPPSLLAPDSKEPRVPHFITIGYGDEAGYNRTDPAIRDAAHAHDEHLKQRGAIMGIAGTPVQVRNTDGAGLRTTHAPYLSPPLPIAGFALIEAADLDEAIQLASQSPCAVAQGLVEVWPLLDKPPTWGQSADHGPQELRPL